MENKIEDSHKSSESGPKYVSASENVTCLDIDELQKADDIVEQIYQRTDKYVSKEIKRPYAFHVKKREEKQRQLNKDDESVQEWKEPTRRKYLENVMKEKKRKLRNGNECGESSKQSRERKGSNPGKGIKLRKSSGNKLASTESEKREKSKPRVGTQVNTKPSTQSRRSMRSKKSASKKLSKSKSHSVVKKEDKTTAAMKKAKSASLIKVAKSTSKISVKEERLSPNPRRNDDRKLSPVNSPVSSFCKNRKLNNCNKEMINSTRNTPLSPSTTTEDPLCKWERCVRAMSLLDEQENLEQISDLDKYLIENYRTPGQSIEALTRHAVKIKAVQTSPPYKQAATQTQIIRDKKFQDAANQTQIIRDRKRKHS